VFGEQERHRNEAVLGSHRVWGPRPRRGVGPWWPAGGCWLSALTLRAVSLQLVADWGDTEARPGHLARPPCASVSCDVFQRYTPFSLSSTYVSAVLQICILFPDFAEGVQRLPSTTN
jgi:hypothetical protein